MAVYIIGYDLNREGANYSKRNAALRERIRELCPTYWSHLDSTWIVVTNYTSIQIRDDLRRFCDANDELLVIQHQGEAAWVGFNDAANKWLKENL